MNAWLVVQTPGIKIASFSVIMAESVLYRSRMHFNLPMCAVLEKNTERNVSFHTSFPPIRVIYLFIFFSFTPWWSQLRMELWVKQDIQLSHLYWIAMS